MRDTTLNTIAVVIFGVTMASLLGPLINLSPAVVAVFAAAGLAVFAVDQLGLSGRIGDILMDTVAWASPEHRQRVLHHEAGHFLAAVLLEIPVEAYTLNTWEAWKQGIPGQGGVVFGPSDPAALARLTPQTIDRYCQVWMAGIAAEQMIYGDAQGGGDDTAALGQFWTVLGRSPAEAPLKQRWATLQAKTLLEKHRDTFDALVTAMGDRAPVADCCALVEANRASVEAAA
ncbi:MULTISPECIES: ATP-dependent Zn protease [Cyanophyceae]|uniref:ATP-dependent Zn protease n=1 Tax=Cyanophyceae TaxID=3028117 RepID=UPI0016854D93|nr:MULTISPECIES: ATP-dependent Zn protease [Cyanophyceae]MBD1919076.1 ATP-dependent Zn protease [Phormidium sp. FACHB-77]MBD2033077.1 ATP-dependent Zn protease [Phormidium sp. FACHB-322]MBD2054005.1 ATP-dependent Zn protease [Leptolyngbya sp. FACHB-60]